MADTNVNPSVSPTATVVTKRPRIKDAVAVGIIDTTQAGVRIVSSTADAIGAVATRLKLHNVSTAADILDEFGSQKVKEAQELISTL